MRDPRERLQDILDAIDHIQRYARRGRLAFESDELIQILREQIKVLLQQLERKE